MSDEVTTDICEDCGAELPEERIWRCGPCEMTVCDQCLADHESEHDAE